MILPTRADLRKAIRESGFMQKKIAAEAGVTEWTMSKIVHGTYTHYDGYRSVWAALGRLEEKKSKESAK